ncbi:MAG TPA: hypothetical protein VIB08_10835, partial [Thermoanaerobaculia bacterium]
MAYWHGVAALAVTALLLYAVLLRWTGDRRVSASASLLWLLLPSTIAVHSFLSARHYLEGLGWSLAACLFARALADPARRAGTDWLWAGLLATTVAAMLSKETYAVALPAYLALDALTRRQRSVAIAMAGLVVAYAAYRTWLVGSGGHYPGSRPSMGEIPAFLKAVTYTLTSNPGGWVFYGFLAAGCAVLLRPRRAASSREVSLIALLLALSVAAILPTASAILATYRTPGTWYRAPFLVHTVALLGAAVLLSRHTPPWIRATAALYFAAALVPGALSARVWWTERLERSRAEGQFYLANPDKLVYSEEGLLVPSWSRSALRGREPAFRQQGFRSGGATTSDARAIPDHLALSQRAIRRGCRSLRRHPQP